MYVVNYNLQQQAFIACFLSARYRSKHLPHILAIRIIFYKVMYHYTMQFTFFLFSALLFIYILLKSILASCVSMYHVHAWWPLNAEKGSFISTNCSSRWFWVTIWLMGADFRSFEWSVNVLNHWTTSAVPSFHNSLLK